MAFTEFYCNQATGAQINAGDLTANGVVTSTNGDWGNAAANRFTAAGGATPFSGVSVGQFASVYLDGATVAVYIGRVTAVNAGGASLDISSSVKIGTAPTTGATGRSCTTGGAWKGPNGTDGFPMTLMDGGLINTTGNPPRVNLKNNSDYLPTATVTSFTVTTNRVVYEGYTSSPGDDGRATIDFSTNAAGIALGVHTGLANLIVKGSASSGSVAGITGAASNSCHRVVATGFRISGFSTIGIVSECEAYGNNTANTAAHGGFTSCVDHCNCVSHDNTGSNSHGFRVAAATLINCISDTNGGIGYALAGTNGNAQVMTNCDAYNNTSDGIQLVTGGSKGNPYLIRSCNLIKNGGYGINDGMAATVRSEGHILNCGFGSGTQANTGGTITPNPFVGGLVESGTITYASNVTPWTDPANGDFRISLAAAKGTGRGTFLQTAASYAGTVGYPDVGAAQHLETLTRVIAGSAYVDH